MTPSVKRLPGFPRKAEAFEGGDRRNGRSRFWSGAGLPLAGLAAIAFAAASSPASAESPSGMVRYDHPVYHNGKRVLWHGLWRGRGSHDSGKATAAAPPAGDGPDAAPAPKTAIEGKGRDYVILADPDDACATRMAGELVAALKAGGLKGRAVAGRTSPIALGKAITGDTADLAIAPMDGLLGDEKAAEWKDRAPYVARLSNETIEILALRNVTDIHQLNGRPVAMGPADSASAASASALLAKLGVTPKPAPGTLSASLGDLAAGKIDAVIVSGGQDSKAFTEFGRSGKFHLVPIAWSPALRAAYAPARLTAKDRPNLIGANEKVDTVAAPMALIALDAAPDSQRGQQLNAFVTIFFEKFGSLLSPNTDANWRDVNLAATANWPRLPAAQSWIEGNRAAPDASLDAFRSIAHNIASIDTGPGAGDADKLYQSLMQWRGVGK